MKKAIVLLFFLFSFSFGQDSYDLKRFENNISNYIAKGKVDLAIIELNNLKSKKNLKPIENQYLHYYSGIYNKYIGKTDLAIFHFKKCLKYLIDDEITTNCYYQISTCFFANQDYDNAFNYARLATSEMQFDESNLDKKIDLISIISYKEFFNGEYDKALTGYNLALTIANATNRCKSSEIQNKIAKIYNAFGDLKKAKECIDKSLAISDSCKKEVNNINALKTWREILISRKMINESEKVLDVIIKLERKYDIKKKNFDLDSIANSYVQKLNLIEKENLRRINERQSKDLFRSNLALLIISFLFFLGFLMVFWIIKLFRKQKIINNQLIDQKEIIEKNNKDLNRFNVLNQRVFSVISHDFKGPLNTLKLLLKNYSEDKNHDIENYIKDISNQINQSDDVLNNLLEWSRSELENNEIEISFNLKELIEEILNELRIRIKEKGILVFQKNTDTDIIYNKSALKIILRNLISNAIKYSFHEGIIEIAFTNDTILITDNGKGIKKDLLEKIFKKKVASSMGTNFETGFGIGLYLSYELIRKNGGDIVAYSDKKKTIFTINLHKTTNTI